VRGGATAGPVSLTTILTRRLLQRLADQPLAPSRAGFFASIQSSHLGGVGLDLMLAFLAPYDQPDAGDASG
jgi:hypothetical protein